MKRFLATAAFLVSIQTSSLIVSCVSGPVTDGGGSGGATGGTGGGGSGGSGGSTLGCNTGISCHTYCFSGHCLPSGYASCGEYAEALCGAGGSTGGGGTDGNACEGTLGQGGECGVCEVSVGDYCDENDCTMPDFFDTCFDLSPRKTIYTGCGYRQVNQLDGFSTDVSPLVVDIWHEESGELVYHSERVVGDVCAPDFVAGEYPTCSGWGLKCDGRNVCPLPPHFECFTSCSTGCLFEGESCADREAACNAGGAGGQGGFGGAAP